MPDASPVTLHHEGWRCTITLNRPERHNAFDAEVIAQLTQAFAQAAELADTRVVVLAARGSTFCAGADLRWMKAMAMQTPAQNVADAEALAALLHAVHQCPVPVVAQVQGDCMGGGVGLVAACDVALASHQAHFALSEVRLGLVPATISPYLVQAMGPREATRWALSGQRFDAATALQTGLVHEVLPALELPERVQAVCAQYRACGPQALRQCKALMREVAQAPLDAALRQRTAHWIAQVRSSAEAQAGLAAFLNRQPMPWAAPEA